MNTLSSIAARLADDSFRAPADGGHEHAVFLVDADGRIASWSPAAERMFGYAAEAIVGRPLALLHPAAERRTASPARDLAAALRDGAARVSGWRRRRAGEWFWAATDIAALTGADGAPAGYCVVARDAGEEPHADDSPSREHDRARATLRAVGDAVLSTDRDGRVDYMNRCAEHLTGWSHAVAYGRDVTDVLALEHDVPRAGTTPATPAAPEPSWRTLPATLRHADGTRCRVDGTTTAIRAADGTIDGWVAVFRDVTRSHASLARLRHDAAHDPLTGLANRAEFDRRLARALERLRGGTATGAVLYLDLDRFKNVNDAGGHGAGDALLVGLARTYAAHVRERDTLARLGGDEFALVVERCTRAEADAIALKLVEVTEAYSVGYRGRDFGVGVSIGVTMLDASTASADEAVRLADRACYAHKRGAHDARDVPAQRTVTAG